MALPGQYQQQDFDKDTLFREKYGTHASGKDRRTFNRYWNSSQREADELAHVQGEIAKSNAYWDSVTQGAINRMRGVPTPAPAKPEAPSLYQTQDFEQAKMAEMYGTDPSKRDQRRFRRYINSEEGQQEWLAHDAAEHQKYLSSMDAIVAHRKAQMQNTASTFAANVKPALVPKAAPEAPQTPPPPAAPMKPVVTPRSDAEWNRIAKENGFTDMAEVKAWQAANGLTADGKFGNTSSAFFKQNSLGKYVRPGSEVIEKQEVPVETPPQQVGFNLETYITDNGLNSKYFDGKRYARVDPNGAGDFWVDDSGKIFESTLGGGLGKEISKSSTLQYNSPYYWDTKRGKAYSSLRSGLADAGATLHKQGGTMNRINYFQQGGAAPQQDIKAQVTALVQAAMQGDQKATQQVNQIMEAAKAGDQQAMQIAQIMEQVVKELQGQAVAAKYGAKLDYLQTLKCGGKAKAKKKEQGGKVCPACEQAKQTKKPVISKHQSGGAVGFYRNWTPDEIRKLQNKLAAYGYYEGELDGIVGSQTINAIKKFQTEHNVTADGMWGHNTNAQMRFVDASTADKGSYKKNWKTEQGNLRTYDVAGKKMKENDYYRAVNNLKEQFYADPEAFWNAGGDTAKWREHLYTTPEGTAIMEEFYGATPDDVKKRLGSRVTNRRMQQDQMDSGIREATGRAADIAVTKVLPAMAGIAAAPAVVMNPLAGLMGVGGAYAGGAAGRQVGENLSAGDTSTWTSVDGMGNVASVATPTSDIVVPVTEALGAAAGGFTGYKLGQNVGKPSLEGMRAEHGKSPRLHNRKSTLKDYKPRAERGDRGTKRVKKGYDWRDKPVVVLYQAPVGGNATPVTPESPINFENLSARKANGGSIERKKYFSWI